MDKYQIVKIGKYNYKMPDWDNWTEVKIVEDNYGRFQFKFHENFYPVLFDDIPEPAIFEEIK